MRTQEPAFPNLYLVLRDLSKTAGWLWWTLVNSRNPHTNEAVFKVEDNLEEKKVAKAYKELRNINLVRRIKRQQYLINPKALIPVFDNFKSITDKWDILKGSN